MLFFIARVYEFTTCQCGIDEGERGRTVAFAPISKKSETFFDQSSGFGRFFFSKSITRGAKSDCSTNQ